MADQFITCPDCGNKIPLTRALRADIERSLKQQFEQDLAGRERELRAALATERERAEAEAAAKAERRLAQELAALKDQLMECERELERKQQDLELAVERQLAEERTKIVEEAQARAADEHRLKDAEKERQLADMRRQIEELRRKAEQGSQQLQGEACEVELEAVLRDACRSDDIQPVSPGVRGADLHHVVIDARGVRAGAILWECKNTRHWSDGWIPKLKLDQRAARADLAILVTACLPRGVTRFAFVDGVLVTDFASAAGIAMLVRAQLIALAHARHAAIHKEEKLELLHRYLTGTDFRHRVEAIVEAFDRMRQDLDQERRAAERQWARRARQLEAVALNVAGMYGDLQGLVPALPPIALLELPAAESEVA